MSKKTICVVGCGYVGLVTGTCLAEIGHRVICVDNDPAKIEALFAGRVPIYEPGLDKLLKKNVDRKRLSFSARISDAMKDATVVFIAVGTPPNADGSADLTFIESVAREIAHNLKAYTVVAEKSTVPVETGEQVGRTIARYNTRKIPFDMVSNPEFLREGTAVEDFLNPDRIVIGVQSAKAEKVMRDVYAPLKANIVVTDLKSAELIKHASNSFLATKISFMNAVGRVCELVGADATQVAKGMGLDPRIGASFLNSGIGFGGFCLPKDLEAFFYISKKVGYDFHLLEAVKNINEFQRVHFVRKLEKALWILKGKRIAVWGVAFKPHTDDIRFAPSLEVIKHLLDRGAQVVVHDPVAMDRARMVLGDTVEYANDPYEAVKKADGLAVVTEWPQYKQADLKRVKRLMTNPVVVDGRNVFTPAAMKKAGFDYQGMGR